MNKKEYPLSVVRDVSELKKQFKKLVFENNDIIEEVKDPQYLIFLRDKEHSKFFFCISNPNQLSDFRTFFNFGYLPEKAMTFSRSSFNNELKVILEHFQNWINLLRQYDEVDLETEDVGTKYYEDEIYTEFEIVDEDAHYNPFEHEKQVALYKLLGYIESDLKKEGQNDPEIEAIIKDTQTLKENIQNMTKKNFIRSFSKVMAKVKKKGIKLFQEMMNEAKKELFKKVITSSFDGVGRLIDQLQNINGS